jgi:DNA-binding NarL/FixJ family response regulator
MSRPPYRVLIADDREEDRVLLERAICTSAPLLQVVGELTDGETLIHYLSGAGRFANRDAHPLPDLLILDLRLPSKGGALGILAWLQAQSFPHLRIAVWTIPSPTAGESLALSLGVHYILLKRNTLDAMERVARMLEASLQNQS